MRSLNRQEKSPMPHNKHMGIFSSKKGGVVVHVNSLRGYLDEDGHIVPLPDQAKLFTGPDAEDRAQMFAANHGVIIYEERQLKNPAIASR